MKLMIIFFTVAMAFSRGVITQELTVEASYMGYGEGVYNFVGTDGLMYEFSEIEIKASEKYDLESEEFVDELFRITYRMDIDIDENDEEFDTYIIVDLYLIE